MNETKCFIYGLALGAAAGILFAPRSGAQTRGLIADSAREGQDYLVRNGTQMRDKVTKTGTELRESVVDTLNRTKRAAKATADGFEVALEVGREELMA